MSVQHIWDLSRLKGQFFAVNLQIYLETPSLQRENVPKLQDPVVRRPISANPELNFNLGLFFFGSKAFSRMIFSILFRASNHQIVGKKNKTEFTF